MLQWDVKDICVMLCIGKAYGYDISIRDAQSAIPNAHIVSSKKRRTSIRVQDEKKWRCRIWEQALSAFLKQDVLFKNKTETESSTETRINTTVRTLKRTKSTIRSSCFCSNAWQAWHSSKRKRVAVQTRPGFQITRPIEVLNVAWRA